MFRHTHTVCFHAVIMMLAAGMACAGDGPGPVSNPEIVKIKTGAGVEFTAAFFEGTSDQAAVFVPGAVFDKESWFFLAERLQGLNIASLSLDGKTGHAVRAAIDFLKAKGFTRITLIGGSMGGAAVLNALAGQTDECVFRIILLAPAGGEPVDSTKIDKLFIVAKEDRLGLYSSVKTLYMHSSEPKRFVEIEGSAHAQHLFKTTEKEALCEWITGFAAAGEPYGFGGGNHRPQREE